MHLIDPGREIEKVLAPVFARGAAAPQKLPTHLAIGRLTSEGADLGAAARQNRDEARPLFIQAQQGVFGAKFTIRYVKEIRASQQTAQALPSLPVGAVIGLIACVGFKVNGHRSIGTDRQTVDQLLEIGTMIFAEAAEQLHRLWVLMRVSAAEFNGSRIIMNLVGSNIKGLGGLHYYSSHQAGTVTLKEPIQGPAQSVIAQMLSGSQSRI